MSQSLNLFPLTCRASFDRKVAQHDLNKPGHMRIGKFAEQFWSEKFPKVESYLLQLPLNTEQCADMVFEGCVREFHDCMSVC